MWFHRYVFCPPEKGLCSPSAIVNICVTVIDVLAIRALAGESGRMASERGFLVEMVLESHLEAG